MTNKEYQRQYYAKNRERMLTKQKAANAKPERRAKVKEYAKQWEVRNREKRNQQQREYYYVKQKPAELAARQESEMIGPAEAAKILGLSLRSMRDWVTDGRIPSTKSPTGRRLIKRADIEALCSVKKSGGFSTRAIQGMAKGLFIVPDGFDLITTYQDLREYTLAFANGKIPFLLLLGSPGSGKSRQCKADLDDLPVKWIDNHVTNLGLYCAVYDADGAPVVLDDVNHFLRNKQACSLLKSLTQTEDEKHVSWESPVKYLEERDCPREFTTTSPMCMIANKWDVNDADMAAIQDRALPVAFLPSAETIHNRVIELGWCENKDIIEFIGENLSNIPQPSMREYYQAACYHRAGMDWRKKLLAIWEG